MTTYDSALSNLRMITRQTQRDGIPTERRIKGLQQLLTKLRTYERKTEPYRQRWLDEIAAYEAHIAELSD